MIRDLLDALACIAFLALLWALCFGVNVGGRHYGLNCSTGGLGLINEEIVK